MKQMLALTLFASGMLVTGACGKKKEGEADKDTAAKPATETPTTKEADPPKEAPKPAAPAGKPVDVDLSAWGPAFKGYVATVPEGSVVEFDDPSRHLKLSDVDYVSVGEAPYWEDAVAGLSKDPDNKNIKKVSDTEYRYERTPPLGTAWAVDMLIKVGKDKFSCTAGDPGTFTSDAMRDQISAICKSIRKK